MSARRFLSTVILLLVVTAAACSSSRGGDDTTASGRGPADDADGGQALTGADADGGTVASSGGSTRAAGAGGDGSDVAGVDLDVELAAVSGDRRIVYRGKLESVVDDAAAAVGEARDAVAAEGGFLFGQEASDERAQVVFKVPSPRFDAAFDAVAEIGEVRTRVVEADDVTEQYTDLDSRRQTLATSIGRLRGFLDRAANVEEIARLESELTRREAEHDVIVGKLRVLDDRTEHATITVTFVVVGEELPIAEDEESGPPGFARGLSAGWDAVTTAAAAVATGLGFALPFAPVVAVPAAGLWWWRRSTAADDRMPSGV